MELSPVLHFLKDCQCGKTHTLDIRAVEIEEGLVEKAGAVLAANGFPRRILVVSDESAMSACEGLMRSLDRAGFCCKTKLYKDMRTARLETAQEIGRLSSDADGILSVGTGSVNDLCRYAAGQHGKDFAIFATAPSMDGFASDSSPIIVNGFKASLKGRLPSIIMADTEILARSPNELKSAGYGDIVAKYIAIADWKIANITACEYLCPRILSLVRQALDKVVSMTDKVTSCDTAAAEAIMEALVLSGCTMSLAGCTRPASGAEHIISHYWEMTKLEQGIWPDFHGKKVGVATLVLLPIYKSLVQYEHIAPVPDVFDLNEVLSHFCDSVKPDVYRMNTPPITDRIELSRLKSCWPLIRKIIEEDLPAAGTLADLMKRAGCATTIEEVGVSPELCGRAVRYSPYMRHRVTLLRIMNMLGCKAGEILPIP